MVYKFDFLHTEPSAFGFVPQRPVAVIACYSRFLSGRSEQLIRIGFPSGHFDKAFVKFPVSGFSLTDSDIFGTFAVNAVFDEEIIVDEKVVDAFRIDRQPP